MSAPRFRVPRLLLAAFAALAACAAFGLSDLAAADEDTTPPDPPTSVVATYVPGTISLVWEAGPSPDVVEYRIYSSCWFECLPQLMGTRGLDDRQFTGPYGGGTWGNNWYGVTAVDGAGNESYMASPSTVGVEGGQSGLLVFASPAPNPSRGDVVFSWTMPEAAPARLTIVDLAGRTVRMLAGGMRSAGAQRITWDGRDARGQMVRPGAYFGRLDSPWGSRSRMLVRVP